MSISGKGSGVCAGEDEEPDVGVAVVPGCVGVCVGGAVGFELPLKVEVCTSKENVDIWLDSVVESSAGIVVNCAVLPGASEVVTRLG